MSECVLDGRVLPVEEARIPVTDEGLLRGDGAFEVVCLYGGVPFAFDDHLARLRRSSDTLRLPLDLDAVRGDALMACGLAQGEDVLLRIVVTRGGHRICLIEPAPPKRESCRLAVERHLNTPLLHAAKSLSYAANMLAVRKAVERGYDDALFVTPADEVLEVTRSSFFWVEDGRIFTPPLGDDEILDSITRRRVLEERDVTESPCTLDRLRGAEEAFTAGTSVEVLGVAAIEGVAELAAPGPVTREAAAALRARIERELAAAEQPTAAA
jgi:branched-chain amino acid aminotransferase